MTKGENKAFGQELIDKENLFIQKFRDIVGLDLLKELYDFFGVDDKVKMTAEGFASLGAFSGTGLDLKHTSVEMYTFDKVGKDHTKDFIRFKMNQLINAPVEEKVEVISQPVDKHLV